MIEGGIKDENEISEKAFLAKWAPFQRVLVKKMEEGSFYKNDDERHAKELAIVKEYAGEFRRIVNENKDIKFAVMSGDDEFAINKILEILNIKVAA